MPRLRSSRKRAVLFKLQRKIFENKVWSYFADLIISPAGGKDQSAVLSVWAAGESLSAWTWNTGCDLRRSVLQCWLNSYQQPSYHDLLLSGACLSAYQRQEVDSGDCWGCLKTVAPAEAPAAKSTVSGACTAAVCLFAKGGYINTSDHIGFSFTMRVWCGSQKKVVVIYFISSPASFQRISLHAHLSQAGLSVVF